MKRGDIFAIGEGKKVYLLCECYSDQNGVIDGLVHNGAWAFTFAAGILKVIYTGESHPAKIVWAGKLPRGIGGYTDTMLYIERRLNRWAITNYLIDSSIRFRAHVARFKRAVGAAKRAYGVVYAANSRFVQDEEDTIPF